MYFLKMLFYNFLIVFFANHILPGIEVTSQTKLPHVGGDLLFAIALALLNTSIFPILKLVKQEPTRVRIALVAVILNFLVYAVIKLLPVGIHVMTVEGYFAAAVVVTVGSFVTNFFTMKHDKPSSHVDMPQ